ncbi:MAG: type III pantothenate kinase [Halieaceae bacterium]
MILQLDIGNTRCKWRLCESGSVHARGQLLRDAGQLLPVLEQAPTEVWVASVAGTALEAELTSSIEQAWNIKPWFGSSESQACGVTNSYAQPERMGVDRWLAMIAAWQQTRAALCVVDAGSALTIDFLAADGVHTGGYILPGLDSMERALLSDTDRVRFEDAPRDRMTPGCSTAEAVLNGLQLSQVGAVALALQRFGGTETLYFTGGNGAQLQRLLEQGGVIVEDLVLDGLACLAEAGR